MKTPRVLPGLILSGLLTGWLASQAAVAQDTARISVVGFSVAKSDSDSAYGGSLAPGLQPGTSIYIQVRLADQTAIKIQRVEDQPIQIQDSTGKTLPDSGMDFGFMAEIADSGKTLRIPITSPAVPQAGADSLAVSGAVNLVCGEDPKSEESEVSIAQGQKLSFAGIEFTVTAVEDSFVDDNSQMFELQSRKSPSHIQQIQAITAEGKVLELSPAGSTEFGFDDQITFGRNYNIPGQAADIRKLRVKYFQKTKEVTLPFEFKVGIGL